MTASIDQEVQPFDVLGPLPSGVAVLEASAGTGKTFTIAALAARYVADGVPLQDLLLVTFTRMATGELRERVRERLVSAERILDEVVAGAAPPADDAVAQLLATGTADEVEVRRERLARAVADFDAATITTTHGFCLEALGSLGFTGDVAADCAFVDEVGDLIGEVVDDLFVRAFSGGGAKLEAREARAVAKAAITNPSAQLVPVSPMTAPEAYRRPDDDKLAWMRSRLAHAARAELDRRKLSRQVMTYDDLLTRLKATLEGPGGATVAQRLRERYRVVLVDEFQDTDPVQWDIMRLAFAHEDGTLVLIGDPKQAIYAFRGADVYAYLEAARSAGTRRTLNENWRSDQGLIDAYDQLFAGAQLGDADIVYRQVRATAANLAPRLTGAPQGAPLRVRLVERSGPTLELTAKGYLKVDSAREHVARDLADDVVALLSSGAQLEDRGRPGGPVTRTVRPGDIAVLVRRNRDAARVRELLDEAGVPAVINGAGSVFAGEPARDWLRLLEALERPTSAPRVRAAALTAFLGWSAERVAGADEDAWEAVHRRLHAWARVLREAGVASLLETITLREQLPERVLRTEDGERELTDLRHIGQLLHRAATDDHLGVAALTAWLRRRIAEAGTETDEERSRRLESDAAAVQVLTIHRSKGLEFPIVYYPYLWDPSWIPDKPPAPVFFHDPGNGDARTLDVGLEGSAYAMHCVQHRKELRGEDLRLAYVALTRAQHQAVVWWAPTWDSRNSPLSRLVFARGADGAVPPDGDGVVEDAAARDRFEAIAAGAPGCIAVESSVMSGLPQAWGQATGPASVLSAAALDRPIDRTWRRTSYSDITTFTHDARVGSEPEEELVDDEGEDDDGAAVAGGGDRAVVDADADALRAVPSLLAEMPGGVHIGTLVHDLLEAADFAASDLVGEVGERLAEQRRRRPIDVGDAVAVVDGLVAALQTPLGPLVGDLRLCDLTRADRLDELTFELPLVGGDVPTGVLTPRAIGAALRRHLPADDALFGYADRLQDPQLRAALSGYLTGSIDLAFRVGDGSGGRPRYGIVDYKSNRLGDVLAPLTAWDHRPAAIRAEMYRSHYALQGLLYTVALHRYLRWRVEGYDPDRDLAGVFYLFLRGMNGADTPRVDGTPCGVFAWRPPGALVIELSDLLERGAGA
jgi:exodeoxyribonuclease V beta subunit